jgi:hypothetical protein
MRGKSRKVTTVVFVQGNTVDVFKRIQKGDYVEYVRDHNANVVVSERDRGESLGVIPAAVGSMVTFLLGSIRG